MTPNFKFIVFPNVQQWTVIYHTCLDKEFTTKKIVLVHLQPYQMEDIKSYENNSNIVRRLKVKWVGNFIFDHFCVAWQQRDTAPSTCNAFILQSIGVSFLMKSIAMNYCIQITVMNVPIHLIIKFWYCMTVWKKEIFKVNGFLFGSLVV
jgi:hypothetical protein